MEHGTREFAPRDRLGETMALLDPRSRRLVELWLAGFNRRQIAAELRICEESAAVIGDAAVREVRRLLARR
jgi:DNA-binding NarL/FixJ family response regulator